MTEAQFASFTERLTNLQTPVLEVQMPPNQAKGASQVNQFDGIRVSPYRCPGSSG